MPSHLYTQYNTTHDDYLEGRVSVRHALLALLSEGPKYGLQLREEFEAGTGEVWPLNVGQVYTTLQRLERDGLVESDDATEMGPQKGFRITPDGAEELAVWLRRPPGRSRAAARPPAPGGSTQMRSQSKPSTTKPPAGRARGTTGAREEAMR